MATRKPKYEPKPGELEFTEEAQREALAKAVKAAVAELPCTIDVDNVVAHAMRVLRSEQSNAIWVMLGLEDKWGKWEFDNCNGRKGVIEGWIRDNCMSQLSEFMQSELGEILELKKEQFRAEIRKDLLREVDNMIKNISKVPWETRRAFEEIQSQEVRKIVAEKQEEIRAEVLRAMSIDPEKYRAAKSR